MDLTCSFEGEDVGTLSAPAEVPAEIPLPFVPLRSVAHLRLVEALAGGREASVDLRGAGVGQRRRVLAMTSRTLTLAAGDGGKGDHDDAVPGAGTRGIDGAAGMCGPQISSSPAAAERRGFPGTASGYLAGASTPSPCAT